MEFKDIYIYIQVQNNLKSLQFFYCVHFPRTALIKKFFLNSNKLMNSIFHQLLREPSCYEVSHRGLPLTPTLLCLTSEPEQSKAVRSPQDTHRCVTKPAKPRGPGQLTCTGAEPRRGGRGPPAGRGGKAGAGTDSMWSTWQ